MDSGFKAFEWQTSELLAKINLALLKSIITSESGSIPLRNWIFLLIPSPIPELNWNWNWLYPVQAELELNWNCHHLNWNWSRNCILRNWIRNCLHGIGIRYEVPHISVAYYSRRLAQVVYTLLVHIDSTKEIRGQLCNCSHNNETVASYQPFHDQVGHGLTITGQWCFLREAKSHQPCYNLYLAELLSLFDQQADLLLPISLFNSTFAKGEVNIQHK